jgi:hypothetical protein
LGPGAETSEDRFRLGVSFAVPDWIRIFAKKDHGGNWRKLEGGAIIVLGLQTIFLL